MNKILEKAIQETTEEIKYLNFIIAHFHHGLKSVILYRLVDKLEHKKAALIKLAEKQEEVK